MSAHTHSLFERTEEIFRASEVRLHSDAPTQAESLFRWTLGHIVLGTRPSEAEQWLSDQLAAFAFSGNRKADARRWTHLLATAVAFGHSIVDQAHHGCRWLGSEDNSPEYALAQYGLALCSAGECPDRSRDWVLKLLRIPHDPEVGHFGFELLFVARALEREAIVRESTMVDVVSRTFADSLWFSQPYSAAAHVCVLASDGSSDQIPIKNLFDRLRSIDTRGLDAAGEPRITFSPVRVSAPLEHQSVDFETIQVTITARGEGTIDPGIHEIRPFSSGLPEILANSVGARQSGNPSEQVGRKIARVQCVLKRPETIELGDQATKEIECRVDLAVAIANERLRPIEFQAGFISEMSDDVNDLCDW
jgi:hypothetical protein